MANSEKDISVNFVSYEPYEHFPKTIEQVGCITESELKFLMSAFDTKSAPNACISSMNLEFSEETLFGSHSHCRYRSLALSEMFSRHTKPLCCKCSDKIKETTKIKRCLNNLKNGKCCDEFIRNTLGAILYPQHYGKQK